MQKTEIEYLDYTWNPLAMRCTPVSEGCEHCWHIRMADRLAKNPSIPDDRRAAYAGENGPILIGKELEAPLHVRKPARIGVQFMGDLFHDSVPDEDISSVIAVIGRAVKHTFIVLTKRPERALKILSSVRNISGWWTHNGAWPRSYEGGNPKGQEPGIIVSWDKWPLENLWLGVTVENQARADERIPILLQIPAAKRWVSIEPMLGAVDLLPWVKGWSGKNSSLPSPLSDCLAALPDIPAIDWVALGGETGPGARPMESDWARSVREQCAEANVPFFFKQHGDAWCKMFSRTGYRENYELDGREWRQLPGVQG